MYRYTGTSVVSVAVTHYYTLPLPLLAAADHRHASDLIQRFSDDEFRNEPSAGLPSQPNVRTVERGKSEHRGHGR